MPGTSLRTVLIAILFLLGLAGGAGSALAQDADDGQAPEIDGGASQASAAIDISVESFGVGDAIRPGEWAGVSVVLTDLVGTRARDVVVRLHVPDPDGDTMLAERRITLNPGLRMRTWIYAPLPWTLPRFFTITVHDAPDTGPDSTAVGRQLAATRVTPSVIRDPGTQFIGVVGPRVYGLNQYELGMEPGAELSSLERFDVVTGLSPEDLPDRWEALLQYETIVWGDADPTRLGLVRPRALEEWVRHGGHLVVMMPSVGGVWFTRDDPLASIMPDATPVRVEDVSYEAYRELLTSPDNDDVPLPIGATVHSFERSRSAEVWDAGPLISGPHGAVVTRRLVGSGMVTVVGLDLADPDFVQRRILRADAFWHRLLGKSFPIPFVDPQSRPVGKPALTEFSLDRHFAGSIENTAQAGVGILLAVVVFMAYWLVAGPLGFGLLKMNNWHRHAWVAFLASVGVFGVVAWLGAQTLKDTEVRARHLTFLDHVHGTSWQSSRTIAGVMMPGYGDRTIAVRTKGADDSSRHILGPWSDPTGFGATSRFPDARSYSVQMDNPGAVRSPVRNTVKTVRAETGGGVSYPTIKLANAGGTITVTPETKPDGLIVHDFPAALENVEIVLCYGQAGERSGPSPASGGAQQPDILYPQIRVWQADVPWAAGTPLDLLDATKGKAGTIGATWRANMTPKPRGGFGNFANVAADANVPYSWTQAREDAERLTWRPMLAHPWFVNAQWTFMRPTTGAGHGLDLARFLTQPCLIITGHLREVESPSVLRVGGPDGDAVPSEGHVVVRWIYPLPPDPVPYSE